LVPDRTGSILIQTGGEELVIEIDDYEGAVRRGIAAEGTRSEHGDVSGFDFVKFQGGTVLYFATDEVHVVLGRKKLFSVQQLVGLQSLVSAIDSELEDNAPSRHRSLNRPRDKRHR
jgi:hypothetical protein